MRTTAAPISNTSRSRRIQSNGNSIYNSLQARSGQALFARRNLECELHVEQEHRCGLLSNGPVMGSISSTHIMCAPIAACRTINVPHRFVLNYLWQMPSPQTGTQKSPSGRLGNIGNLELAERFPSQHHVRRRLLLQPSRSSNDQAQVIGKPQYTSGSGATEVAQWFTTDAFTTPATQQLRQRRPQYTDRTGNIQCRLLGAQNILARRTI